MPITGKVYPEWVQKHRKRGMTVKKVGDSYYLYKRTSRRCPGKKYPQPVDKYVGLITENGVVYSDKKKMSTTDVEVWEYGFSRALWVLCPDDWKKPLGNDWEDVLRIITLKWSPESYVAKEKEIREEGDFRYQFQAQMGSLSRRIFKANGVELKELEALKRVYLVIVDGNRMISKTDEKQEELIRRLGITMEV